VNPAEHNQGEVNMSFANLKRRKTNFDELQKKFETKNTNKSFSDDRFFYPVRDDQGNGSAELRFLPTGDTEDSSPFASYFLHKFKGPGGWFWHKCRTTIGEECPVCDSNRSLIEPHGKWESTPDSVKQVVRERKRNQVYVANVLVVKAKDSPDLEGKVMLFQFGTTIMDKIKQAINPQFEDDPQFDPFNPWEGANFIFKIRKVKGQTNYDSSAWGAVKPVYDTDEEIEALGSKVVSLVEFDGPDSFTSVDVQEKALARALGKATPAKISAPAEAAPSAGRTVERASTPVDDEASELEKMFASSDDAVDDDIPF
jgi:hypothetical protein